MSDFLAEYIPCDSLSPFIELYWNGSFSANRSGRLSMQMIPNGCLELIIHLNDLHCELQKDQCWSQTPDYMILGLFTQPYEVHFTGVVKVFAIRFKPEGLYNIFGLPASVVKNRYEDMTTVLGTAFLDFSNRIKEAKTVVDKITITEQYLLQSLLDNQIEMGYVNLAAQLIRSTRGVKIEDLPNLVCISQRQLEREFKDKIGVSPKHYLRLTRINEVLRLLQNNQELDLTQIAYHCGYFDQAHFIKDFKRITGKNPSIFVKDKDLFIANTGLAHYEH